MDLFLNLKKKATIWIENKLDPRILTKDTLFVGKNDGKYNEKYFFVLQTNEDILIMDRTKLRVVDTYSYTIQSINYAGMDIKSFNAMRNQEDINIGSELVKTMSMLPKEV